MTKKSQGGKITSLKPCAGCNKPLKSDEPLIRLGTDNYCKQCFFKM